MGPGVPTNVARDEPGSRAVRSPTAGELAQQPDALVVGGEPATVPAAHPVGHQLRSGEQGPTTFEGPADDEVGGAAPAVDVELGERAARPELGPERADPAFEGGVERDRGRPRRVDDEVRAVRVPLDQRVQLVQQQSRDAARAVLQVLDERAALVLDAWHDQDRSQQLGGRAAGQ